MAEIWRYQDRLASAQLLTKRPRPELDDVLLHSSAGYGLDYGKAGAAYGSVGLARTDIVGLGNATLLGAGVTGSLRAPNSCLSGLMNPQLSGVDLGLLKGPSVGLNGVRSDIFSIQDVQGAQTLSADPSPTLFIEGFPIDCSRREAAHIFRPFRGFKEVRMLQKGSKRAGVLFMLCFVEFEDSYCAAKAMEALQGYKLDEDDQECEPLRLHFARRGIPHESHKKKRRKQSKRTKRH